MEIRRKAVGIATCLLLVTMVLAGVPPGAANASDDIVPLGSFRPMIEFNSIGWNLAWSNLTNWPAITLGAGTSNSFNVTIRNIGTAPANMITVQAGILDPALYLGTCGYERECTIAVGDAVGGHGETVAIADVTETLNPGDAKNITFTVQVPENILGKGFRAIGLAAKYYKCTGVTCGIGYPGPYYSYPAEHYRTVYFFAGDSDWKADVMAANTPDMSEGKEVRYQLNITLEDNVTQASLCVLRPGASQPQGYELYVNNVKVYEAVQSNVFPVDLTHNLTQGLNTIEIRAQYCKHDTHYTNPIVVEGGVLLENGKFIRIAPTFDFDTTGPFYAWQSWNGTDWQNGGKDAWTYNCTSCVSETWKTVTIPDYYRHAAGVVWYLLPAYDSINHYRFPPTQGPIYVEYPDGRPTPIFDYGQDVELTISIPRSIVNDTSSQSLKALVIDGFTGENETGITLTSPIFDATTANYTLSWTPTHGGVWDVYLTVSDSEGKNIAAEKYLEVAVVDEISQNEVAGDNFIEGLDNKKLVKTIDCCLEMSPYGIDEPPGSSSVYVIPFSVVDGYRETGQGFLNYFSYVFNVSNLAVPHLIEVEYPDNEERAIGLRIGETAGLTLSGQKAAFVTLVGGEEYPNSPGLKKIYAIYWPSSPLATVEIVNFRGGTKAAASRITIYEITDDLPALKINSEQKDRLFGVYAEKPSSMMTTFTQPWLVKTDLYKNLYSQKGAVPGGELLRGHDHPGFYKDWYVTISNLVKYMEFSGQNVYLTSLNSYSFPHYPSRIPGESGLVGFTKDHIDLMAKIFEENHLSLILALQLTDNYAIQEMDTKDEDWNKNRSVYDYTTIRMITKDGYQLHVGGTDGGFNYFIPEVEAEVIKLLDEIGDLYGKDTNGKDKYPAIKGICFHGAMADFPGWASFGSYCTSTTLCDPNNDYPQKNTIYGALNVSYDDWTWAEFTKSYPGTPSYWDDGANRFHDRYNWARQSESHMNRWINWRCQMTAGQITRIRDCVNSTAPDWKIYLSWWDCSLGGPYFVKGTDEFYAWTGGDITYDEALRSYGFEISLPIYNDPNVVVARAWDETPERKVKYEWGADNNLGAGNYSTGADILSEDLQCVANPEKFAQGLRRYWLEYALPNTSQNWVWTDPSQAWWGNIPSDRYFAREYVASLKQAVPNLFFFFQSDMNLLTGSEQGMRHFAQAYRTIPPGHYEVIDNQTNQNIAQNLTIGLSGDKHYLYIANQSPQQLTVKVTFSGRTTVTDLVTPGFNLPARSMSLELSPYDLKTFTLDMPVRVDSAVITGGCLIATAAYGTPMAEEIEILREFRDEYLLTNPLGQALVDLYYSVSPPIAEFITEHPSLNPIVRAGLVPAVTMSTIAVNTTPTQKAAIVGLLVLVSVALATWTTRRRGRGPQHTGG